jgi:PAS domain S-box-containing protein
MLPGVMPRDRTSAPAGRPAGRVGGVLGLVAIVLFLVVDAAIALHNQRAVQRTEALVSRTHDVRLALTELVGAVRDAERGQRGYLLTGRESYLAPYHAGAAAAEQRLGDLRRQMDDDPPQAATLGVVADLVGRKLAELEVTIRVRRAAGLDAAREIVLSDEGKRTMDAIRAEIEVMLAREDAALAHRERLVAARHRTAAAITLATLVIGLGLVGLVFLVLARGAALREAVAADVRFERERLRITLTSIGDAVVVTDATGRVTLMNARARELTGVNDGVGRPLEDVFRIVAEASREPMESPVARVLREGRIVGLANHTMLLARNGTELPIDDSGAPIRDADGAVVGVVLVFRDVRATRRAEAELRRRAHALEEADRRKDEFLAMLSHELRNPLAAIHGGLHVVARAAPGSEQTARALAIVERQTTHLARLVDDLLDVTRISRGKITLRTERVDLAVVVRRAAEDQRATFASRGVALAIATPPEPAWIDGDPTRLAQVVGNLLQNSAKFTSSGGHATVDVAVDAASGDAIVRVRDDGVGIAPELLPRIFEPFTQAAVGLDRADGGLGLGLAVVRALVELHGGRVAIASEGVGRGTEITIRLPLASAPASIEPPPASGPRPSPRRVLVVEDNADAADSLREVLDLDGHTTRVAHLGAEGLRVARDFRPDVILCDLGLPDLDGFEVARAVRADVAIARTTLVALSGYARPEDVAKARAAGFDFHLAKPPDLDKLGELLRAVPGRAA